MTFSVEPVDDNVEAVAGVGRVECARGRGRTRALSHSATITVRALTHLAEITLWVALRSERVKGTRVKKWVNEAGHDSIEKEVTWVIRNSTTQGEYSRSKHISSVATNTLDGSDRLRPNIVQQLPLSRMKSWDVFRKYRPPFTISSISRKSAVLEHSRDQHKPSPRHKIN